MGSVYLALDNQLDRQVALKVPHFTPADGPEVVARFYQEARAAATLDHPNLCQVYDVGQIDGTHYMTMPFLEGRTLSECIEGGRMLDSRQSATVARKLAMAMAEAHARGVIHRDLKPSNIMVDRRRELVVMDFGLAHLPRAGDARLTRTGAILGTPAYMSPEQVLGETDAIGAATDIYALGVILYELMTGRCPFEGPPALVMGLITLVEPEHPSRLRPEIDSRLAEICLKAMSKKVEARHASMGELAGALGGFLTDRASGIRPPPGTGGEPQFVEAKARESSPGSPVAETQAIEFVAETISVSRAAPAAHSAPTSARDRSPSRRPALMVAFGIFLPVMLTTALALYLQHDRARLGPTSGLPNVRGRGDVDSVPDKGGGGPTTLPPVPGPSVARQGNGEGETLSAGTRGGEKTSPSFEIGPKAGLSSPAPTKTPAQPRSRITIDEDEPNPWPAAAAPGGITLDQCLIPRAFSPDLLTMAGITLGTPRAGLWSAGRGLMSTIPVQDLGFGNALSMAWDTDGRLLAIGGKDSMKIRDVETNEDVHVFDEGYKGPVADVSFSPNRRFIACDGPDNAIRIWDEKLGRLSQTLTDQKGITAALAFSPDNYRLLCGGWSGGGQTAELKVWDLTRKASRPLLGHVGRITGVAWSPDRAHLASVGDDRTARLWDAETLDCVGTLEGQSVKLSKVAFSRDGRRVATAGIGTVWVWEVDSKSVIRKFPGPDFLPGCMAFSPRGRWLLVAGSRGRLVVWDTLPRSSIDPKPN